MKRILHLISSIQGNESYSLKLGQAIVKKAMEKFPDSTVEEVNLNNLDIPHLNPQILQSMFTPGDQLTPEAKESIRYSDAEGKNLDDCTVLIVDNIGLLSRLYRYGEFAFVGGGYGKGLHNILEAACYGIPILFGNRNYDYFFSGKRKAADSEIAVNNLC